MIYHKIKCILLFFKKITRIEQTSENNFNDTIGNLNRFNENSKDVYCTTSLDLPNTNYITGLICPLHKQWS